MKRYTGREKTRLGASVGDRRGVRPRLVRLDGGGPGRWLDDEAWTTGDGPKALFHAAVAWLREHTVLLLPGVTTLTELVGGVRQAAEDRLYDTLAAAVTTEQARSLEATPEVPEGRRRSQLDLWRRGARVAGNPVLGALPGRGRAQPVETGVGRGGGRAAPTRRIRHPELP